MRSTLKEFKTIPNGNGFWEVKNGKGNWTYSIHASESEAWKEARRLACGAGGKASLKDNSGDIRAKNIYSTE